MIGAERSDVESASSLEGTAQGDLVGVLEVATDRQPAGESPAAAGVTSRVIMPSDVLEDPAAFVPVDPDDNLRGALVLRNRSLVLTMAALFELAWEQAPLFADDGTADDDFSDRSRELLNLLQHGLQAEMMVRHLGLGVRTVRRDIARLLDVLGTRSRFEAGVLASRRDWL